MLKVQILIIVCPLHSEIQHYLRLDVPDKLISTHKDIQNLIESSAEKCRVESKARIEEFRLQEEERLNKQLSKAKSESNQLWSKIIQVKNNPLEEKKERGHVRFAPEVEEESQSLQSSHKKPSFDLDESAISSSLKDLKLDHLSQPNFIGNKQIGRSATSKSMYEN